MDSVMYEDVVTFCPDLDTFRIELTVHDHVDEEGKPELSLTKTPGTEKTRQGR
ncbi:hypothetical protein [Endozoicomonas lisbonensis]|uniref:hypothetical protein n=1 Tax=Endozoicomonas lisbonensis TaxID=3120522 RepID=UPI003396B088